MIFEERLPGTDDLVMELELIVVLDLLALHDVFCGDVELDWAHISLGQVGGAGVIEQRQGAAHTGPDGGGGDALLYVPGHGLEDVLAVVHGDLHHVIQQAADVRLDVIELPVTLTGRIKSKIIVDLQIVQHEAGRGGVSQLVRLR